jgi:predicted nucleic acid-binding protein
VLVADSSVWIDFFSGHVSPERTTLRGLLDKGDVRLVVPDLVLFEVLRGFRSEREHRQAAALLATLDIEVAGGEALAREAVHHYRHLRSRGVTIRSGNDVLIATFCARNGYALLHKDRDFLALAAIAGFNVWHH